MAESTTRRTLSATRIWPRSTRATTCFRDCRLDDLLPMLRAVFIGSVNNEEMLPCAA